MQFPFLKSNFSGRQLSKDGIKVPTKALDGIRGSLPPTDKSQLRSFLGLANYYRCFIPNFSERSAHLYKLLDNGVSFSFGSEAVSEFESLKEAIATGLPLAFFDTNVQTKTILTTDASSHGIGGVLTQIHENVERPIYFVSRKLRAEENNYSSSEKETLAVLWCIERLHQYLFGRHFEVRTDHQPLREVLTGKFPKGMSAPARISRWATRLLPYSFTVTYIKGKTNFVADGLSRLPSKETQRSDELTVLAIQGGELPCVTLQRMAEESSKDKVLSEVSKFVRNGWPSHESQLPGHLKPYFRVKDELSILGGLLLRADKVIPPDIVRDALLSYAHQGHFGMGKTKARYDYLIGGLLWIGKSRRWCVIVFVARRLLLGKVQWVKWIGQNIHGHTLQSTLPDLNMI